MAKQNKNIEIISMNDDEIAQRNRVAAPRCILIVEDDPDMRLLNAAALTDAGYRVETAEDGAVGWAALNRKHYDLLITDNAMPKVTGVELLKKLSVAHIALPVIMASGVLPFEEFAHSPWLQPSATLLRPYNVETLLATVKRVLSVIHVSPA